MDINDLFDGIMKSINQFAGEIAEQRLQEKMQDNGLECSEQTVREPQSRNGSDRTSTNILKEA